MYERILALYPERTLRRSAMRLKGGGGMFEAVMSGKGYRTALEIGTYRGCAAAEMSQYCERVITIDLHNGQLEQGQEKWDRHTFWRTLGITNISLALVADDLEKAELIHRLDFDFAFVDGAHDERVANDFFLVRRCGNVLFHDAEDGGPGRSYVHDFLKMLPKDQVKMMDIFALWTRA